jgi:hypothetical protein
VFCLLEFVAFFVAILDRSLLNRLDVFFYNVVDQWIIMSLV